MITVYDEIHGTERKFRDIEKAEKYAFSIKLACRDERIPTTIERDINALYVIGGVSVR